MALRETTITREQRDTGTLHESATLTADSGSRFARVIGDLALTELQNPALTWRLEVWESLDAGTNWKLACFITDQGRVGRTQESMIVLTDPKIGDLTLRIRGRVVPTSGRFSIGARVETE